MKGLLLFIMVAPVTGTAAISGHVPIQAADNIKMMDTGRTKSLQCGFKICSSSVPFDIVTSVNKGIIKNRTRETGKICNQKAYDKANTQPTPENDKPRLDNITQVRSVQLRSPAPVCFEDIEAKRRNREARHRELRRRHEQSFRDHENYIEQSNQALSQEQAARKASTADFMRKSLALLRPISERVIEETKQRLQVDCSVEQSPAEQQASVGALLNALHTKDVAKVNEFSENLYSRKPMNPTCGLHLHFSFNNFNILQIKKINAEAEEGVFENFEFKSDKNSADGKFIRDIANDYQVYWYKTDNLKYVTFEQRQLVGAGILSLAVADKRLQQGDPSGVELGSISESLLSLAKGFGSGVVGEASMMLNSIPETAQALRQLYKVIDEDVEQIPYLIQDIVFSIPEIVNEIGREIYRDFEVISKGTAYERSDLLRRITTEVLVTFATNGTVKAAKISAPGQKVQKIFSGFADDLKLSPEKLRAQYNQVAEIKKRVERAKLDDIIPENAFDVAANSTRLGLDTISEIQAYASLFPAFKNLPVHQHPKQIMAGSSDKIALIGSKALDPVENYWMLQMAKELRRKGVDAEVFIPTAEAKEAFLALKLNFIIPLTVNQLVNTDLYRENIEWATRIKKEAYTVLDIGDPVGEGIFDPLYSMEKNIIWDENP